MSKSSIKHLVLFQKVCDLLCMLHPYIARFPKNERFVLGQHIENELLEFIKNLMRINGKKNKTNEDAETLCGHLEVAQVYVRLAKDMRFIIPKAYLRVSEALQECIRICEGYCRSFSFISVVREPHSAAERG